MASQPTLSQSGSERVLRDSVRMQRMVAEERVRDQEAARLIEELELQVKLKLGPAANLLSPEQQSANTFSLNRVRNDETNRLVSKLRDKITYTIKTTNDSSSSWQEMNPTARHQLVQKSLRHLQNELKGRKRQLRTQLRDAYDRKGEVDDSAAQNQWLQSIVDEGARQCSLVIADYAAKRAEMNQKKLERRRARKAVFAREKEQEKRTHNIIEMFRQIKLKTEQERERASPQPARKMASVSTAHLHAYSPGPPGGAAGTTSPGSCSSPQPIIMLGARGRCPSFNPNMWGKLRTGINFSRRLKPLPEDDPEVAEARRLAKERAQQRWVRVRRMVPVVALRHRLPSPPPSPTVDDQPVKRRRRRPTNIKPPSPPTFRNDAASSEHTPARTPVKKLLKGALLSMEALDALASARTFPTSSSPRVETLELMPSPRRESPTRPVFSALSYRTAGTNTAPGTATGSYSDTGPSTSPEPCAQSDLPHFFTRSTD